MQRVEATHVGEGDGVIVEEVADAVIRERAILWVAKVRRAGHAASQLRHVSIEIATPLLGDGCRQRMAVHAATAAATAKALRTDTIECKRFKRKESAGDVDRYLLHECARIAPTHLKLSLHDPRDYAVRGPMLDHVEPSQ